MELHWIHDMIYQFLRTILLERALGTALETFPCSMAVFGILQVTQKSSNQVKIVKRSFVLKGILDRTSFGGEVLARRVPTYFGMIVALFQANEKGWKVLPRSFTKGGQIVRP